MTLKEKLLKDNKKRWLDVGCGGSFKEGFHYLDLFPEGLIDNNLRKRYFRVDILNLSEKDKKALGKFDLLRMQHFLEHFSWEEGFKILKNCSKLLNKGGIILITTPDLKVHANSYLNHRYKSWKGFKRWANKRIPEDAPNSFYFSIFAHSMPFEAHKWCYDSSGLKYLLKITKRYKEIKELTPKNPLSSTPFTHNRLQEDVCVIAKRR